MLLPPHQFIVNKIIIGKGGRGFYEFIQGVEYIVALAAAYFSISSLELLW
jgi:hypothetical protein